MHAKNFSIKKLCVAGFMLVLIATSACGARTEKWKEEVQLSDGTVIVVERETLREAGGDELTLNSSGSKPKEHRMRFTHPSLAGVTVEWKTTKLSPRNWPEIPLILEFDNSQLFIMTSFYPPQGCETYAKYVYQNDVWVEEPLPEKFEQRKSNLFLRSGVDMPKSVSLQEKRKENADLGYRPALRQVGPTRLVCG